MGDRNGQQVRALLQESRAYQKTKEYPECCKREMVGHSLRKARHISLAKVTLRSYINRRRKEAQILLEVARPKSTKKALGFCCKKSI
jgi:hypothetical protein